MCWAKVNGAEIHEGVTVNMCWANVNGGEIHEGVTAVCERPVVVTDNTEAHRESVYRIPMASPNVSVAFFVIGGWCCSVFLLIAACDKDRDKWF